jgi:hypothetical protein
MGMPAVPEGSPSSLERWMSRSGPRRKAEQWCRASWNSRRRPATRSLAASSLSARRSTVMNLERLISISWRKSGPDAKVV